ncbi:hypothetical protein C8R43DRAFT_960452 [Mycena crocata]|nr:hypothetical protein C8R43DRAFT_960452 [Mycena crocata]
MSSVGIQAHFKQKATCRGSWRKIILIDVFGSRGHEPDLSLPFSSVLPTQLIHPHGPQFNLSTPLDIFNNLYHTISTWTSTWSRSIITGLELRRSRMAHMLFDNNLGRQQRRWPIRPSSASRLAPAQRLSTDPTVPADRDRCIPSNRPCGGGVELFSTYQPPALHSLRISAACSAAQEFLLMFWVSREQRRSGTFLSSLELPRPDYRLATLHQRRRTASAIAILASVMSFDCTPSGGGALRRAEILFNIGLRQTGLTRLSPHGPAARSAGPQILFDIWCSAERGYRVPRSIPSYVQLLFVITPYLLPIEQRRARKFYPIFGVPLSEPDDFCTLAATFFNLNGPSIASLTQIRFFVFPRPGFIYPYLKLKHDFSRSRERDYAFLPYTSPTGAAARQLQLDFSRSGERGYKSILCSAAYRRDGTSLTRFKTIQGPSDHCIASQRRVDTSITTPSSQLGFNYDTYVHFRVFISSLLNLPQV